MARLTDDSAPGVDARHPPLPGKCDKRMSLGACLLDALQAEDVQSHTSYERCLLKLVSHTNASERCQAQVLCARNGLDGLGLYGEVLDKSNVTLELELDSVFVTDLEACQPRQLLCRQ